MDNKKIVTTTTKLVEHWNQSSKKIPDDKDKSQYAVEKEKLFLRTSNVCDLGGGMGADSIYFLKQGHSVTLLDVSDFALSRAKVSANKTGLSDKLTTQQIDLSQGKIPLSENSFDVVYSRLALHYFKKETLISLYKEIYRILKAGGIAFISVKSAQDKKEMEFLKASSKEIAPGIFEDGETLKVRFTKEQLEAILKEAGISNFNISEFTERFAGRKDFIKSGNEELVLTDITIKK